MLILIVSNLYFRFPFYYELKIVFVIWLLSPATKGSSVLYRKFVHPELMKREEVTHYYRPWELIALINLQNNYPWVPCQLTDDL